MNSKEITDFQTQVKAAQSAILHFENLPNDTVVAFSDGSALAKSEAEGTLAQPVVKERICAALQSISNDLDKITEKTTESLWGMVAVGTLVITQNPFVYAWIGILVYRATVKGFCVEFQKNSEAGKK
jgi:hypothetical protein